MRSPRRQMIRRTAIVVVIFGTAIAAFVGLPRNEAGWGGDAAGGSAVDATRILLMGRAGLEPASDEL